MVARVCVPFVGACAVARVCAFCRRVCGCGCVCVCSFCRRVCGCARLCVCVWLGWVCVWREKEGVGWQHCMSAGQEYTPLLHICAIRTNIHSDCVNGRTRAHTHVRSTDHWTKTRLSCTCVLQK